MSLAQPRRVQRAAGVLAVAASLAAVACTSNEHETAATTGPAAVTTATPTTAGPTTSRSPQTTEEPTTSAPATSTSPPSTGAPGEASYAPAPCPNPVIPGDPESDLGAGFECGYLTVPENRSRQDGRTIRLAVATAKATTPNPKADPIVLLAGGPGGSALQQVRLVVGQGWNAERDVMLFEQRGTYKSDPSLTCPEVDSFVLQAVRLRTDDPAASSGSAAAAAACRQRLTAAGDDLAAYDTTENAADVADLRVALGIDEWNIFGYSYGTDLALHVLRDHPDGIRTLVLDSVVPAQANLWVQNWPNAAEGYRALFDACAAQPACSAAFPELESEFETLVTTLNEQPRTVPVSDATGQSVDVVIDGYKLANLLVLGATGAGAAQLPAIIRDLVTGPGTKAAAALIGVSTPAVGYGWGLTYGVSCREWVPHTTPEHSLATAKAALPEFPDEVSRFQVNQAPHIFAECDAWDVPAAPASVLAPTSSDIPVLMLSGTLDAISPPSWAELAARSLPNARLVQFPGAGHVVVGSAAADCAVAVMGSFLDDPSHFDPSCVAALTVPPFATS